MPLEPGDLVESSQYGTLEVGDLLGKGSQGQVFLVRGGVLPAPHALKWYFPTQATEGQRSTIQTLSSQGPPKIYAGRRFIWPLDLVTATGQEEFGYLMPRIDTHRFTTLREIWSKARRAPNRGAMCEISYQLANSYRALHLDGYCYRDISDGNIMFDPLTGDTLICDNDNIGVTSESGTAQVWGTWEYMAPEVARREATPSADTDLHSLAVLLFRFWMWFHHPLHGAKEYNTMCWDDPARLELYGKNPVFIFDPEDDSNRVPDDPDYRGVKRMWSLCPKPLKELFTRAFTKGLQNPHHRVTEAEWQAAFLDLKDKIIRCPECGAENFWDDNQSELTCWNCWARVPIPPKLIIHHRSVKRVLLLIHKAQIRNRHLEPYNLEEKANEAVGQILQHPTRIDIWGLRNTSDKTWTAHFKRGTPKEHPPNTTLALSLGDKLMMNGVEVEVTA